MGDWSNLPHDLVVSIAKRIHCLEDFIKFRSLVYTPWNLVVNKQHFTEQELPWIMLHTDSGILKFQPIEHKDKIYKLHMPEANNNDVLCSSSLGWLITVNKLHGDVKLFHLFDRPNVQNSSIQQEFGRPASPVIELGELELRRHSTYNTKFVLSSSPSCTSDYMAMCYSYRGGFSVFCGNKWKFVDNNIVLDDIAYYQGQFYGVSMNGQIIVYDIEDPEKDVKIPAVSSIILLVNCHHYLVESGGSLLVVSRFTGDSFGVYKVTLGNSDLSEVKDLGTRSLFLSRKNSFSVEASNSHSCRANCIYYTECQSRVIFNMEDGTIEKFTALFSSDFWFQPCI